MVVELVPARDLHHARDLLLDIAPRALDLDDQHGLRVPWISHFDNRYREYEFTTNQHGEHRAFVDSTLYDQVMPLDIATMPLVKAVMAEDYEAAESLGLLEVDSEDFALPTFVCPSKMEMTEIMKKGLKHYAKEQK